MLKLVTSSFSNRSCLAQIKPTNKPILSKKKPDQLWSDQGKRYCDCLNLCVANISMYHHIFITAPVVY